MTKKETPAVIRVSPEVIEHIEAHGKYGDSPDSVLRRLLGLPEKADKRNKSNT